MGQDTFVKWKKIGLDKRAGPASQEHGTMSTSDEWRNAWEEERWIEDGWAVGTWRDEGGSVLGRLVLEKNEIYEISMEGARHDFACYKLMRRP